MRLQNNNLDPVQDNSHHSAVKDQAYIEEAKPIAGVRPDVGGAIAKGISDISLTATNILYQFQDKKEQIQATNINNDFLIDYNNRTKRYKIDYAKNPQDKNLTTKYESDIKKMITDYQTKLPPRYQNEFFNKTQQVQKQNDLDLFREQTSLEFEMNKLNNRLDENLQITQEAGYNNNKEALAEQIAFLEISEQQIKNILGEQAGTEYIQQYKHKLVNSYTNGVLQSDSPIRIKHAINDMEKMGFVNILKDNEKSNLIRQAESAQEKIDQWNKHKEVARFIRQNTMAIHNIDIKNMSYGDIIDFAKVNKLDEYEAKFYLKAAGYDTTLPPELRQSIEQNEKERKAQEDILNGKHKWTNEEKLQARDHLETKLITLISDQSPYEYTEDKQYTERMEKIKQYQREAMGCYSAGLITKDELNGYMSNLNPLLDSVLTARNQKDFKDDGGWLHAEFGYKDAEKQINSILVANGIDISKDPSKLEKGDRNKYYKIRNTYQVAYRKSLENEFEKAKKQNPGKYNNINNWQVFYKSIPAKERKEIYRQAQANTLKMYANEEGIGVPQVVEVEGGVKRKWDELDPITQTNYLKNKIAEKANQELQIEIMEVVNR